MTFDEYLQMQQKARRYIQNASKGMMRYCSAIENQPYWTHAMNVHNFLVAQGTTDHEILIAAILHDAIEDLGATKAFIAEIYTPRIAEIVDVVSKPKNYDPEIYYKGILNFSDDSAMKIKVADRIDNILTFYAYSEDALRSTHYLDETNSYFMPMAEKIGWKVPLLHVLEYYKNKVLVY